MSNAKDLGKAVVLTLGLTGLVAFVSSYLIDKFL